MGSGSTFFNLRSTSFASSENVSPPIVKSIYTPPTLISTPPITGCQRAGLSQIGETPLRGESEDSPRPWVCLVALDPPLRLGRKFVARFLCKSLRKRSLSTAFLDWWLCCYGDCEIENSKTRKLRNSRADASKKLRDRAVHRTGWVLGSLVIRLCISDFNAK